MRKEKWVHKLIATVGIFLCTLTTTWASVLEVPGINSTLSGISVFSGWKCIAGIITVRFDGGDPIVVPYGSERNDTITACGDADNGFVLLINYNVLGPGVHEAVAFDDGVEFARVTFVVVTSGVEFLTGVAGSGILTLSNGHDVSVAWSEAQQGFIITAFSSDPDEPDPSDQPDPPNPGPSSVCTTKMATGLDVVELSSTWEVMNPCDGETLTINITPLEADGFFTCIVSLDFVQGGVQFGGTLADWTDNNTAEEVCDDALFGTTKQTTVEISDAALTLDFSQPFQFFIRMF